VVWQAPATRVLGRPFFKSVDLDVVAPTGEYKSSSLVTAGATSGAIALSRKTPSASAVLPQRGSRRPWWRALQRGLKAFDQWLDFEFPALKLIAEPRRDISRQLHAIGIDVRMVVLARPVNEHVEPIPIAFRVFVF
jgi:hypothetical protein